MKKNRIFSFLLAAALLLGSLAGCSAKEETAQDVDSAGNVGEKPTIKVAFNQTGYPITFVDDDGNDTGYDVEVFKLVAERLSDEYNFEFVPTTDDDILVGLQTGAYQVSVANNFYTPERAETYIIPKEWIGVAVAGFLCRAEDADKYTSYEAVAESGARMVPIAPNNGQYTVINNWNTDNPDSQIELLPTDSDSGDANLWVLEGRYDVYFLNKPRWDYNFLAEDGVYHEYVDQFAWNPVDGVPTWPLFNKDYQELADRYDEIIRELKEEGIISDLLIQWIGEDSSTYLDPDVDYRR